MKRENIAALVLAAGYSSRMDGFKPMLKLGDITVIERVIRLFRNAEINDVRVVVGHRANDLIPLLDEWRVRWVLNENYPQGMITSIKAGVATLGQDKDGFFLLPVDIPLVRRSTLSDLIHAYHRTGKRVVYPCFGGKRGHPPLISTKYTAEILRWDSPGGLREFLNQKEDESVNVEVSDEHIMLDMDTPSDYRTVCTKWEVYDIPSVQECMALLKDKFSVRGQLLAHSRMVAKVAFRIGRGLNANGSQLNLHLIAAASLLHDIAKGQPAHASVGARMLRKLDYPEVADIVEVHMLPSADESGPIRERDVVCLSDKLVQADRIVPLETRFQKQLDRYAGDAVARQAIETKLANARRLASRIEDALGTPLESYLSRL